MAQITLDGLPEFLRDFEKVAPKLRARLRLDFNETSVSTVSWLRTSRLTGGTTGSRLAVRSGKLRASVRPELVPASTPINQFDAGVSFGTIYAHTHIRSAREPDAVIKGKPWLAIPTSFARTKAGVGMGGMRSGRFQFLRTKKGKIVWLKTKKGDPYAAGQLTIQKGARAGQARGKIVPLFILKKSVKIPKRITTEEIVDKMGKILLPRLRFIAKEAGL